MSSQKEDLDLLLSLQDRIPDTPPGSPPSNHHPFSSGYLSDDGSLQCDQKAGMSVFRDAVKDYLLDEPTKSVVPTSKSKQTKQANAIAVEKFSGLRIQNQLVTASELSNHFSDIRFIQLQTIGNLLIGDTISGCWATVGVLSEKGLPKMSSTGKDFCIWKLGCLNELHISVFLFGDAYTNNSKEPIGTIFSLFNSNVRKDAQGKGFSLSVYSANQIMKLGTSTDYGVCKGKRNDGMACTMVVNKRHGAYCSYHNSKAAKKCTTSRSELKVGNLKRAFVQNDNYLKSQGIHLVNPLTNRKNLAKPMQPAKILSVDGLKKVLSNSGQYATKVHSQGLRFLREIAGHAQSKDPPKVIVQSTQRMVGSRKRSSVPVKVASSTAVENQQSSAKRMKMQPQTTSGSGNMIELDVSSDEEC